MSAPVSLSIALAALGRNALRTLLAVLGLVIGVAAVVTMVALGTGAQSTVTDEVKSAGTNLIFVRAGNYTRGGDAINIPSGLGKATTLIKEDADAVAAIDGVAYLTPEVDERAPFSAGERQSFGPVHGVGVQAPQVHGWSFASGGFFTAGDVAGAARVAVLGPAVREDLFASAAAAIGQTVQIRNESFLVVGVLETRDADHGESVFVPYPVLQEMLGIRYLHGITVHAETAGESSRIAEELKTLLRARHGLDDETLSAPQGDSPYSLRRSSQMPDDFTVRTQATKALAQGLYTSAAAFVLASMPRLDEVTSEEMVSTLERANQTMTLLLASIATVSLVVGGIGIMNIMLLAVTERTREIGLRVSVGARRRDVLYQFLAEAVALSLFGGVLGIGLGFATSAGLTALLEWPTRVSPSAVALAFGLAFAVGVLFGYYPAHRASRLDPIDALRYE